MEQDLDTGMCRWAGIEPLDLSVEDLERSAMFFERVFGMVRVADAADGVTLRSPLTGHRHLCIRLTTEPVAPATGFQVEMDSTDELLDVYMLAQLEGYGVGALGFRRGWLTATVNDPDGHLIELKAARLAGGHRDWMERAGAEPGVRHEPAGQRWTGASRGDLCGAGRAAWR